MLVWGWPLQAMADHLEAVSRGEITRLLTNCPPGLMKSLLHSVLWPAWEWGPAELTHMRYLASSYSQDNVTRAEPFSVQCEASNVYLVQGAWNEAYLDELCLFPGGAFKDQVDATSGAFGRLVGNRKAETTTKTVQGLY